MIETNEYINYDETEHFFSLTEAGLTELSDVEPNVFSNPQKRLKTQGRLLHEFYTRSAYNENLERYRHVDNIDYKVYLNNYNEQTAIKRALVLFAELSDYDDLDLRIRSGEATFPQSIISVLQTGGVYIKGELQGEVPEEDYYNGY